MPKTTTSMLTTLAVITSIFLSACAMEATPHEPVEPVADPELVAQGQRLFNLHCMACHSVDADGRTAAGPHLEEIFGRQIATDASWVYPEHIAKFDFVWTHDTMRQWLVTPQEMVNNMCLPFRGLRRESDVDALMAYLLDAT